MGRQRTSSVLTLGVVAALGAAVLVFSADPEPAAGSFVAVGSTSNNGNPSCKGTNNASCATNPNGGGPVKTMTVKVTNPDPLFPTVTRNVMVSVTNPFAFEIVVQRLDVTVAEPNKQGCVAPDLEREASPMTRSLSVPAGQTRQTSFWVKLDANSPDQCQNAVWNLTVAATAVQR